MVTFETFLPDLFEGVRVDPAAINGVANQPFLTGDGAVRFTLSFKSAVSIFANTLGVYKVGGRRHDLQCRDRVRQHAQRGGRRMTVDLGVPGNGERIGFFLIQDGFDIFGDLPDNLSFLAPGTRPAGQDRQRRRRS